VSALAAIALATGAVAGLAARARVRAALALAALDFVIEESEYVLEIKVSKTIKR